VLLEIALTRKPNDIRPSEITSESNYLNRRDFIRAGAIAGGSLIAPSAFSAVIPDTRLAALTNVSKSPFSTDETPNSFEDISTYNNFYEFGLCIDVPVVYAEDF
jgi:sulfoxide reductase catalytic subunit YedY